jgi:hypothetical protein
LINTFMRIDELLKTESDLEEWKASKALCKSSKADSAIGASALSSCRSQGLRARSSSTKKSQKVGKKRVSLAGKKLKSTKYGGPISPTRTG